MTQTNWQTRLTHQIGQEIRRRRDQLNMTADDLSDETDRLGMRIERTVIANLENRRRAAISIAEVLVLAKALRIPPVMLFLPVGDGPPTTEVLPGKIVSTWAATKWVSGEAPFAVDDANENFSHDDRAAWEVNAANLDRYRKHDLVVRDLMMMMRKVNNPLSNESMTLSGRKFWRDAIDGEEKILRATRDLARRQGLSAPDLPESLRYIDAPTSDSSDDWPI